MFGINKKDVIQKNVFTCGFKCRNCYYEWEINFIKGTNVIQKERTSVITRGKKEEDIVCPNCDSEMTAIIKREQIKESVNMYQAPIVDNNQMVQMQQQYDSLMKLVQMNQQPKVEQPVVIENVEPVMKVDKRRKLP
jgi:hypothetical protein